MNKNQLFLLMIIISMIFSCQGDNFDPYSGLEIVSYDRNPIWTPDGTHILFEFRREIPNLYRGGIIYTLDQLSGIWSVAASGDSLVHLLRNDNINVNNLKFDIDSEGEKLTITFDKYIYTINIVDDTLDHSSLFTVAEFASSNNIAYPKWQPSGEWLVFENVPLSINISEVYLINSDGTGLTYLFDGLTPSWHPDGQSIIAGIYNTDTGYTTDLIRYYPFSEADPETLYVNPGNVNIFPAFSPDGSQIAFQSSNDDSTFISIMDTTGDNISILASGGQPAWSPDGNTLVFTVLSEGSSKIWLIEKDGTNLRRLNTDIVTLSKIK
jgi:Tol biopolymer transport system component